MIFKQDLKLLRFDIFLPLTAFSTAKLSTSNTSDWESSTKNKIYVRNQKINMSAI